MMAIRSLALAGEAELIAELARRGTIFYLVKRAGIADVSRRTIRNCLGPEASEISVPSKTEDS
jgi:hypothetical protein